MVIKTIFTLEGRKFDIDSALLYGKLDEDLWMAFPEGYDRYIKEKHNNDINTKHIV
jgi:hypothetical protein